MDDKDLAKCELLLVSRKGKYNLECWLLNGPKKERISDVQGVEELKFIKKYGQGFVMGGKDEGRGKEAARRIDTAPLNTNATLSPALASALRSCRLGKRRLGIEERG